MGLCEYIGTHNNIHVYTRLVVSRENGYHMLEVSLAPMLFFCCEKECKMEASSVAKILTLAMNHAEDA